MRLSVIIPCYNAEPYVAQTIRSVLEQTRPADEIIVVDDGSTDGSIAEVRQFGDRVRFVTGRNGGASPTRNKGVAHASGDALMFLDADDVLGPTVLKALTGRLARDPGAIAVCPWYRLDLAGEAWVRRPPSCAPLRPGQDPLSGWLTGWYHPPCSVLWSREAYERTGGWDVKAEPNDDGDLMMRALVEGGRLVATEAGDAYYRRLPQGEVSLSGTRFTAEGLRARIYVADKIAWRLEQHGRLGRYRDAVARKFEGIASDCGDTYPALREQCEALASRYAGSPLARAVRRRVRSGLERVSYRLKGIPPQSQRGHGLTLGREVRFGLEKVEVAASGTTVPSGRPKAPDPPPPRVSVVIPTYNRALSIGRALESVLAQIFRDFEVLVVDDGSTDDTAEVIAGYEDTRVRYLVQPQNRGVGAARNRGLREARGEFVAFLDSDDEWFPSKLEQQVACFDEALEDVGLVYCGIETVDGEGGGWTFEPELRGHVYEEILNRNPIHTGSGVVVRREVVRAVGFFDEEIPAIEDFDYWLRIARHYAFEFVAEPLVRYYDLQDTERKSLDVRDNLDARARLFEKHRREMQRAGVAHLFLLESARRHRRYRARGSKRLAWRALKERPQEYRSTGPWVLYLTLPGTAFRWVRRAIRPAR